MKNLIYCATLILTLMLVACDKESVINENQLPKESQTFLDTHFSGIATSAIIKDKDGLTTTYEVYLVNGFEIDFKKSGEWDDVDCKQSAVPTSIIALLPAGIAEYCTINFPNVLIVEVNKEHYGYEIGLSNDLDLEFDTDGGFRKID
ncbi:hypothetical protein FACS1894178_2100 [Bacteroidia bacterium]|nr:hypothetical protein FACS1894178_2100 [Bacteroidia bacterium]